MLAALLVDAGRPVPVGVLTDRVWGQAPPRAVRPSLQAHITRIRQLVGRAAEPGTLGFAANCYLLEIDPLQVDLHRFRHLVASAGRPPAAEPLRQAMALWRGEPLAGLPQARAEQSRQAWRREQLVAAVAWAEAELRAANPAAVIPVLGELARDHPLTESLAAVLMRALAAAGRPADALSHYESVRRHLVAELGTDPSPDLQAVYRSILRGEPLPRPSASEPPPSPRPPIPPTDATPAPARPPADATPAAAQPPAQPQADPTPTPTQATAQPQADPTPAPTQATAQPQADPTPAPTHRPTDTAQVAAHPPADATPTPAEPAARPRVGATPVPAQLPADVAGFAGRDEQLADGPP